MTGGEGGGPHPKTGICVLSVICFCKIEPNEFGLHLGRQFPSLIAKAWTMPLELVIGGLCEVYLPMLLGIYRSRNQERYMFVQSSSDQQKNVQLTAVAVYRV